MNTRNNQRFQQTDQEICNYVLKALEEKPITRVTVTEICEAVHINRSSFYLHYTDVFNLMDRMCERKMREVADRFGELQDKTADPMDYLRIAARHAYENQAFYRIYIRDRVMRDIEERMGEILEKAIVPYIRRVSGYSERRILYQVQFLQSGILAVFWKWIADGCQEEPEQIVEWVREMPGAQEQFLHSAVSGRSKRR